MTECCSAGEEDKSAPCCATAAGWVCGSIASPVGDVVQVATDWSWNDHWGRIKSRLSAFRMKYSVTPGLYAVGKPDMESELFVSANYKLSFDLLRRALKGRNAWILVLDTRSINVWCAAGKGTFSTEELVRQLRAQQVDKVLNHRRVIVPQLGAVGVSAHRVKKESGFHVCFGPVHAQDIPAFINSDYNADQEMRRVGFGLLDRLVLTPMEILPVMKAFLIYALISLTFFGFQPQGLLFKEAWVGAAPFLFLGLVALFAGAFLTPVLLPWVPFRSFGIKGWIVGIAMLALSSRIVNLPEHNLLMIFATLFFPMVSSYLALQFTGSTPFTGRSGVEKELKIAVPIYLSAVAASLILLILFKIQEWGTL